MKNLFLVLIFIGVITSGINAQGIRVVYKEKLDIDPSVEMEGADEETVSMIKSMLKDQARTMCLYFDKGESLYEQMVVEKDDHMSSSVMIFDMSSIIGSSVIYKNQTEKYSVAQEYILDRPFIITEELKKPDWKLLDGNKEIQGFECKRAFLEKDSLSAWYCPQIPVNDGPMNYWGLPGLILEIEMDAYKVTAEEIILKADVKDKIFIPKKGKKTDREKYEKLKMDKMMELGNGDSDGPSIQISIEMK